MRQPIGLYLTEFAASEAAPIGLAALPSFDVAPPPELTPMGFDFAEPAPDEAPPEPTGFDDGAEPAIPLELPAPEPDTATVVAALEAEHAAALAAARQQWAEQEGATLAAGLATALAELEARIADTLAPLLEPFLVQAAQIEALAQLRVALRTLLDSGEAIIAVSGPADLLAAIRDGWTERRGLAFNESDGPDVTVTMGETRIHLQLAGWARALEDALGAPA